MERNWFDFQRRNLAEGLAKCFENEKHHQRDNVTFLCIQRISQLSVGFDSARNCTDCWASFTYKKTHSTGTGCWKETHRLNRAETLATSLLHPFLCLTRPFHLFSFYTNTKIKISTEWKFFFLLNWRQAALSTDSLASQIHTTTFFQGKILTKNFFFFSSRLAYPKRSKRNEVKWNQRSAGSYNGTFISLYLFVNSRRRKYQFPDKTAQRKYFSIDFEIFFLFFCWFFLLLRCHLLFKHNLLRNEIKILPPLEVSAFWLNLIPNSFFPFSDQIIRKLKNFL